MSAKIKRRARIVLDMTPMVDIAFLLVIFFMSTYHARPPTTVDVVLPDSRSPLKVPEANVMVINVLAPEKAKELADSIGPTNLITLINNIREASAETGLTVAAMRGMAGTLLPSASEELLREIASAPGKPLSKGRSAELAIREAQRPKNFINQWARQEVASLTPEQYNSRVDSMIIWYATGKDAAQPLPIGNMAGTVVEERMRNPKMMMVLMVDKDCLSGKMLDLTSILQKRDVNMLRFSLVTNLKADAKPVFGEEGR
jgi:biopolymer transport protein ExbD